MESDTNEFITSSLKRGRCARLYTRWATVSPGKVKLSNVKTNSVIFSSSSTLYEQIYPSTAARYNDY